MATLWALAASLALTVFGQDALASSLQTMPQVGVPGCLDDVAVRATRQLVTFSSRGQDIRAYLYAPGGPANGAAIVMLHGGTGFEMNSILFDAHAIQLASRGYWVLLPAYFDAAQPDPRRRTVTARAWRQAALDAVHDLEARPGVQSDRVALWGYSRGGGVAVDAITVKNSPVRTAILVATGGTPDADIEERDLAVLLMHARRDEAVPVRATITLAEALRRGGADVEVRGLDFDGHQYDLQTWCSVMSQTRGFLQSRAAH